MREFGAEKDGVKQSLNKRLFIQLLVFDGCRDLGALAKAISGQGLKGALYADANNPRGAGLVIASEDPAVFPGALRDLLNKEPFASLTVRHEFTMLGRTYSLGFEQDLEDWLLKKPLRNLWNEKLPWAVWYPLRRRGEFETLSREDQRGILMEHAKLGMSYGQGDLAHDVRLACHGLDTHDNEFVIGVIAPDLHNISRLIQDMRRTQQTSKYIQSMGPFFVGKVTHRFQ